MCRKAGKYEIGRTKILWGLHLFISTYFPDCCFPLLDISLCQNEHHTTHFKVTFPTHKTRNIRPTSTYPTKKLPRPPHLKVFQVGLELSFTNIWERTWNSQLRVFLRCEWRSALKAYCKSRRSKVRLGFNGHLRTAADPNMPIAHAGAKMYTNGQKREIHEIDKNEKK